MKSSHVMRVPGQWLVFWSITLTLPAMGCLNDSFTRAPTIRPGPLGRNTHARLAEAVRSPGVNIATPTRRVVVRRLAELEADPFRERPSWWNDIGAAHIRLGNLDKAVALLEEARQKFPDDYGVHANLGTAYHLQGRYQEAEKEIATDLRINVHGHYDLETYHLALLQYLAAPAEWQKTHVFLDEWTDVFFGRSTSTGIDESLLKTELLPVGPAGVPEYRTRLKLALSPEQENGVAYLTGLNPTQPACFVMAGILALKSRDGETAKLAFERAIALGSPQSDRLSEWIDTIDRLQNSRERMKKIGLTAGSGLLVGMLLFLRRVRKKEAEALAART